MLKNTYISLDDKEIGFRVCNKEGHINEVYFTPSLLIALTGTYGDISRGKLAVKYVNSFCVNSSETISDEDIIEFFKKEDENILDKEDREENNEIATK